MTNESVIKSSATRITTPSPETYPDDTISATTPSTTSSTANAPPIQPTNDKSPAAAKLSLIEVYEHEYYDPRREAWIGGWGPHPTHSHRWTSSSSYNEPTTKYLPPPPQIHAPEGYEFTSDWKIDVTGNTRDELGWEFFFQNSTTTNDVESVENDEYDASSSPTSYGRRRRHWLRTVSVQIIDIEPGVIPPSIPPPIKSETILSPPSTTSSSIKAPPKPAIISPSSSSKSSSSTAKTTTTPISPLQRRRSIMLFKALRPITDSFNFKGHGWTFYKSNLSKYGGGVSWRMPLSAHFDFFDRRPHLPLVSSSFSLFYPWKGTFYLNASLPVELLKDIIMGVIDWLEWIVNVVWCFIYKTMLTDVVGKLVIWKALQLIVSFLKLIILGDQSSPSRTKSTYFQDDFDTEKDTTSTTNTRNAQQEHSSSAVILYLVRRLPTPPPRRTVVYHQEISERLGFSLGWSISQLRGFEFRVTWWHMYLPTVEYVSSAIGTALRSFPSRQFLIRGTEERETAAKDISSPLSLSSSSLSATQTPTSNSNDNVEKKSTILKNEAISKWLRQKTGAVGVSWGGFTPYPPYFSFSSALSLSGFYFNKYSLRKVCAAPIHYLTSKKPAAVDRSNKLMPSSRNTSKNETLSPLVMLSPYDDDGDGSAIPQIS